jgi:hypothetical protein
MFVALDISGSAGRNNNRHAWQYIDVYNRRRSSAAAYRKASWD